jgi:hypothetical protein
MDYSASQYDTETPVDIFNTWEYKAYPSKHVHEHTDGFISAEYSPITQIADQKVFAFLILCFDLVTCICKY